MREERGVDCHDDNDDADRDVTVMCVAWIFDSDGGFFSYIKLYRSCSYFSCFCCSKRRTKHIGETKTCISKVYLC